MPRLRDTRSGVVVNVDDATAARLGQAYEPVDVKKAPVKKATAKAAVKSD